jgi:hypothetical protein
MKKLLAAAVVVGLLAVPTAALSHGTACDAKGYRPFRNGASVHAQADNLCPVSHPRTYVSVQLQRSQTASGPWSNVGTPTQTYSTNSTFAGIVGQAQSYDCHYFYRSKATGWQTNSSGGGAHNNNTDYSPNLQETC